ncbi:hypothetical protein [Mesorhizobium escarrei]|uniref:Uncharacterized protein n=1 Tax=Mesorhizobium escarrei TaxID=666018 RepID=A0ABN8KJH5_9HYPH|nr:hypothetical protein [Mesorhizobium escarrei]CAH2409397.1 exported hypothetical protein [Mesorhizobium escarrei]
MTNISNFKRLNFKHLSLAAAIVVSAFGSISVPNSAVANGTHPGGGGAVCKGRGSLPGAAARLQGYLPGRHRLQRHRLRQMQPGRASQPEEQAQARALIDL